MSLHHKRSFASSVFRLTAILILPTSLVAAIRPTHPDDLVPVDRLQQILETRHTSKKARTLKRAYDLFQKKRFFDAIALSSKMQSDELYSDYGFWIAAQAQRELATFQNEKKNYSGAIQAAQKAISHNLQIEVRNPYSPFVKDIPKELAKAELLMGEAYWGTKKWSQAEKSFERAFQRMQTQNMLILVGSDALSQYAESCKKSSGPLCQGWLQKFSSLFNKKSDEAKAILQHYPEYSEKTRSSRSSPRLTQGYKSVDLDQAAIDAAMRLYFEEKYSQASKALRQFVDDFPRSAHRFRARYWLAQALTHEQEHEKAQKIYQELQQETPLTYYGFLSAMASGKPVDTLLKDTLPMGIDSDPSLLPQEIFHLKRAENFLAEKAYDLAAYELRTLRAREGISSPFLVYLAILNNRARNFQNSFQLLGELIQRGYDGVLSNYSLKMIFPVQFLETIKKSARETGLDPILVLSLIKQESAFDEDANSSVGAMGLMQLMPATAVETDPDFTISDLLEPESNISVGTKYLKKLLTRYNGNIVFALAGYNAGPNAVDRWIRDSGGKKGMLEFIESIPYRETREYVGAIIRNYFWYSKLISGTPEKSLNYFWNSTVNPDAPVIKPQNGSA